MTPCLVDVPAGSPFPIENLPLGVGRRHDGDGTPVALVAIGDHAVDLGAAFTHGLLAGTGMHEGWLRAGALNPLLAEGRDVVGALRDRIALLLSDAAGPLGDVATRRAVLVEQGELDLLLPIAVGDYVDFYSSIHHATNLGRILRPGTEPLLANWRHLPVSYHGRAGTVVVSGTDVVRPHGMVVTPDGPRHRPTDRLDIELEIGTVVGVGSPLGLPIPIGAVGRHLAGVVLLNDWSARDIQAYEYQPLGPHLGKSFATSISPWVVTMDALEPYRVAPPVQDPPVSDHLQASGPWGLAIDLEVWLQTATMRRRGQPEVRLSHPSFADLYWTIAQQLAHLTTNGASTRPGDLFGSGTVSGPEHGSEGSFIELTRGGAEPITLPGGEQRSFLADGDQVTLRGWCGGGASGLPLLGLGEVTGTILPASSAERGHDTTTGGADGALPLHR